MLRPDALRTRRILRVHVAVYSAALALLAILSWVEGAWGYLVLYALVLVIFALVVGVASFFLARSSREQGTFRAAAFLKRSLRSFVYGQITLATAMVAAATLARLTSGPLGPFPGGAFDGVPSMEPFEEGFAIEGYEIQLQIPRDPPYTSTTHAFRIV